MDEKLPYSELEQKIKVLEQSALEAIKLQEALHESEERYRLLFEEAIEGIFRTTLEGRFLMINAAAARMLGYDSPQEAIEKTINIGSQIYVDPEERKALIDRLLRKGKVEGSEVLFKRSDGSLLKVMLNFRLGQDRHSTASFIEGSCIDITDRWHAEEALRKSEELHTRLVDTIPDVIVRTDLEGKILFVNNQGLRISGYGWKEIQGHDLSSFADPKDRERLIQALSLMRDEKQEPQIYQLIMKNGQGIPFEMNGDVLRSADGTPFGFVHAFRDLSEHKRSQKILKEKEEQLRGIMTNIPGIVYQIYIKDTGESGLSYISERFKDFFELKNDMNNMFPEFLAHIYEDDRSRFLASVRNAVEGRAPWNFEGRYVKASGETIWFHGLSSPTRHEDRLVFDGILLDITERKRAEEKSLQSEENFRKVFVMAPDMVTITKLTDGLIVDVNLGFEDITGWKRNEVIGRTSYDLNFWVNQEDRECMVEELKAGRDVVHREISFRHKDGSLRTGIYSARSFHAAGEFSLIFVMQDITDRKRMEEDRQRLEQQLFLSQKMDAIGQLAGGVAHDFNNMLSVIIGNTEMALNGLDPADPLHKSLDNILNAGMRSADLTRQLLAFARKQTISPKVLDLNDTVAGMLKMLQRLIGENIHLVWMPGPNLWRIKMDPSQVDQLLANLTVNARDAMNKKGEIIIETSNAICDEAYGSGSPEYKPGEYVLLAVTDDGCGMDKEILSNIFEPFFTTKKDGHGTGLGLATVYGIVTQNGGFVHVYSEPGLGTTFKIYLPNCREENREAANGKGATNIPKGTETILIAEDEESVLRLSKDILETLGYKVLAAKGTDLAIRLAREYRGRIDLLLTDVVMPDMNGKELSERILTIRPGLKCLYMSGYTADVITRQEILEEGVQFIPKPFSIKDLAIKVRNILD